MGSEGGESRESPVRQVTVSGFWMQEHEVTNREYRRFDPEHSFEAGKEEHPVVNVTWDEAMDYARLRGGSLPTEARWEFAARGTEGREYPWGDEPPTCDRAQYRGCDPRGTIEVNARPLGATPDSIYDLAGNVLEWVADWYDEYDPEDVTDPRGPESENHRVLRGGAFNSHPRRLRAAFRGFFRPGYRGGIVGFRVAWSAAGGQ